MSKDLIITGKGIYKTDYYRMHESLKVLHKGSKKKEADGYWHKGTFLSSKELSNIFDIVVECGGSIDCYVIV